MAIISQIEREHRDWSVYLYKRRMVGLLKARPATAMLDKVEVMRLGMKAPRKLSSTKGDVITQTLKDEKGNEYTQTVYKPIATRPLKERKGKDDFVPNKKIKKNYF